MIVRVPSKIILFGEHAVVYGEPAISMAINIYVDINFQRDKNHIIDGKSPDVKFHSYILKALELTGYTGGYNINIKSHRFHSSGLGSSAAVTVGTVASVLNLNNDFDKRKIAKISFDVEYAVQGRASPIDTSTETAGGIIYVGNKWGHKLWEIEKNERRWEIRRLSINKLEFIIANSGIRGSTAQLVSMVSRFVKNNNFGMDIIHEIGELTDNSVKYLEECDCEKIGELMNRNNKLLTILGVGNSMTSAIIDRVGEFSYGAKITGAGGGGSVIILPKNKEKVIDRLKSMNVPYVLAETDIDGVRIIG
ncbi:MAG: mevalonate kinase [Thermoplasmata archaeon]